MRKRTTETRGSENNSSRNSTNKPDFKRKEGGFNPDKRTFSKPFASKDGYKKQEGGASSSKFPSRVSKPGNYSRSESQGNNRFPKKDFNPSTNSRADGSSDNRFVKKDFKALGLERSSERFPKREYNSGGNSRPEANAGRFAKKDSDFRNDRFPRKDERADNRNESFPKKDFGRSSEGYKGSNPFKSKEGGYDKKGPFEKRSFDKPRSDERREFSKPVKPEITKSNYGRTKNSKAAIRPNYDEDALKSKLPPKVKQKVESVSTHAYTIRLNRYLANAGLCSRREADEFIASGQITVNGKEITEMGYQVKPTDVVKYGRKILNREKLVYLLLNKPKDFLTTTDDPEGRKTVMDLLKNACTERIYPVGRLDRATTGLLLVTNDGELADKLSHPSNNMRKVYQVEIDKPIVQEDFDKILEGIELEDGIIKADDLSIITPDKQVVGIEIHSGKNRIVRRIFESLGYEVTKLDRTTYAGLTKKDLPRGNWRFLSEKEVIRLKYLI
ncbi:pseudouridine synthase [Lacihabitans sp. LS3-19]|uniref:pseudouridine synthase n=1 Tax=Lacihabitans sp. LS3-19 TaxID=2487335 RepID=UPI0020CFDF79|nr:pseudouridine synthase [Lacihabitans sp. LS3-19]MCP9766795.1 pseudouridine synthase [Lacihabitans sp. LS3-19]